MSVNQEITDAIRSGDLVRAQFLLERSGRGGMQDGPCCPDLMQQLNSLNGRVSWAFPPIHGAILISMNFDFSQNIHELFIGGYPTSRYNLILRVPSEHIERGGLPGIITRTALGTVIPISYFEGVMAGRRDRYLQAHPDPMHSNGNPYIRFNPSLVSTIEINVTKIRFHGSRLMEPEINIWYPPDYDACAVPDFVHPSFYP